MPFILNPYDNPLDLSNKEGRRLYEEATKGLDDTLKLKGSKDEFNDFRKLIGERIRSVRLAEAFQIVIEWETGATPRNAKKVQNIFDHTEIKAELIDKNAKLVWADTAFGGGDHETLDYFKIFDTKPANHVTLNNARNARLLKHVMLGKLLWNSLAPKFQLEMLTEDETFKRGEEYDGILLWNAIIRRVNPTTKISIGNLKDELESASLEDFGYDVKSFNTWFVDKRNAIVREVGEGGYTEYERCLFKIYKTAKNEEFLKGINNERSDWMLGRQHEKYDYSDIMKYALTIFNNMVALKEWEVKGVVDNPPKNGAAEKETEPKFLALMTEIKDIKRSIAHQTSNGQGSNKQGSEQQERTSWRWFNPEGATTKTHNNRTYKWCTNDCHSGPMWCARRNCMNKEDWLKAREKKDKVPKQDDFKIALSSLLTEDQFKEIETQFF